YTTKSSPYFSCIYFSPYATHHDILSFPTRRSSDLAAPDAARRPGRRHAGAFRRDALPPDGAERLRGARHRYARLREQERLSRRRSEEHTSELQSRENLICRLLLEKKNY